MLTFKLQLISFKLLDSDSKFELYVCTCSILSCGVAQFNFVRIFFVVLKGTGRKKSRFIYFISLPFFKFRTEVFENASLLCRQKNQLGLVNRAFGKLFISLLLSVCLCSFIKINEDK